LDEVRYLFSERNFDYLWYSSASYIAIPLCGKRGGVVVYQKKFLGEGKKRETNFFL